MPRPKKTAAQLKRDGQERERLSMRRRIEAEESLEGVPTKPDGMSEIAAAEWDRLFYCCNYLGALKPSDGPALEETATLYAQLKELRNKETRTGGEESRIIQLSHRYFTNLGKFGLNPADRQNVLMESSQKESTTLKYVS